MARPLTSVLLLGYNQSKFIEIAVNSVLEQSHSPLEIILSDDCSDDDTFEIMKRLAKKYTGPHKIILNQNASHRGLVGNLNTAANLASGVLLVQANGSDISTENRVTELFDAWQKDPENIKLIYSDMLNIDLNGAAVGDALVTNLSDLDLPPLRIIYRNTFIAGSCVAFTSDVLKAYGVLPECAAVSDHILPFRASVLGKIVHVREVLVRWRLGGITTIDKFDKEHPHSYYQGERVRVQERMASNHQAHLIDFPKIDFEDREDAIAHSRKFIQMSDFFVTTSKAPFWTLIFRSIPAYLYVLTRNDRHYLRLHGQYLFKFFGYRLKKRKYDFGYFDGQ